MLNKGPQSTLVPTDDGGNRRIVMEPFGFNVEECGLFEKMIQDAPSILRRKTIEKVAEIIRLQGRQTSVTFGDQLVAPIGGNLLMTFQHVWPRSYPGAVE